MKLLMISLNLDLLTISPWGEAEWAIDPWPLRVKGLIVFVSAN